ncbi:unnamed protein product [Oppiella nova]|uniref:Uncharacterized protein n=1 Tax=Oppiella nova TaxID=334625 RepID=A0A7R9MCD1_9ACAR|nr:unnamed protein product [Oppiella nova]CAG2173710.1 unnamed protein product [Oppiella nova]
MSSRYGPPRNTEYRVIVENLSSRVSWQSNQCSKVDEWLAPNDMMCALICRVHY